MERRLIVFFVLAAVILASWSLLYSKFGPKPVAKKNIAGQKEEQKPDDAAKGEPEKPNAAPGENQEKQPAIEAAQPSAPESWISAGSLAAGGPHRFLATFSTRGAALERVELSDPRYQTVDDMGGYLGELRLTPIDQSDALKINVVGAGTPAQTAKPISGSPSPGLAVGDELLSVDGKSIQEIVADYQKVLDNKYKPQNRIVVAEPEEAVRWFVAQHKPEAVMEVKVKRGDATPLFAVTLARRPLSVISRERFNETATFDQSSFLLQLASLKESAKNAPAGLPDLSKAIWRSEVKETPAGIEVEFRYALTEEQTKELGGGKLEVVKRYTVPKIAAGDNEKASATALDRTYHLGFTIEIVNQGEKPISTAYRLEGPTGLPIEGWWYTTKTHPKLFYSAGARDVVFDLQSTGHRLVGCSEIVGNGQAAKADEKEQVSDRTSIITSSAALDDRQAAYFGVDSLYFASVLIPKGLGTESEAKTEPRYSITSAAAKSVSDLAAFPSKQWNRKGNVTFELLSESANIEPGKTWKSEYEIFVGPKSPELLARYGIPHVLELGWFAFIARILSGFLHFIYSWVGSYAIAILLLTVTVRCCVLPFSLKAAKGAAVMQQLAPEMQKIKDRHKDDPAAQHKAMQELWRKHNYNPLSGCLPVFLQIPIFVALYKCLSTDIELRGVPLIPGLDWARNLAGPDMLWHWQPYIWDYFGSEVGWLGPYFNFFPLITVGLFLWQQMLFTPPATNDEMKMQQQMMKFMTVFMGVMFFKVPAGLCIYFITSSLWGICERLLLFPKPVAPPAASKADSESSQKKIVESRVKAPIRK